MNENLNDIFSNSGNDVPLNVSEDGSSADEITVEIVNSANDASRSYTIYPENTLKDVLNVCKNDLGLASSGNQLNFEIDGTTYSDPNLTVQKLGISNGTKLLINPSGKVAAELAA
ncbi:MAG: hypothetical protein IKK24_03125 [Clostridia bacterium]|nr:hypothetical protein [Clostridia bacterium]